MSKLNWIKEIKGKQDRRKSKLTYFSYQSVSIPEADRSRSANPFQSLSSFNLLQAASFGDLHKYPKLIKL